MVNGLGSLPTVIFSSILVTVKGGKQNLTPWLMIRIFSVPEIYMGDMSGQHYFQETILNWNQQFQKQQDKEKRRFMQTKSFHNFGK